MKDFIKKNKFFMTLLAIMIIITAALVVYDVQKWYKSALPNEDNKYKSQVKKQLRSQALPVIINACKAGIYYMFNGITAKQRIRWKAYI